MGLSGISLLTRLSTLNFSRIKYPHAIPSEFTGLSALKGIVLVPCVRVCWCGCVECVHAIVYVSVGVLSVYVCVIVGGLCVPI